MTEPRLVGSRYELDGVVGRGGMAEVYRGHDLRLDRQVAVKALRADLARDPTFQERFRREAQSAASLNHPSIIAVYDTGEDLLNGSTVPYIVMEYVAGRTLRDMLRDDRQLLPERGLEIVAGVLHALEYSHAHGIVHRDIKPANIMITTSREVKVMDFGIARALHDASSTMTQTAQVVGTAQYLSPEQARGERVDARSDVYSTGCVLYEILTGNPPFRGDSPVAIAYQHVREEPVPPSQIDPDLPSWGDPLVLRAMAKDADYRYQGAEDMRADIQRALAGQQVASTSAVTSTQMMGNGAGGASDTRAIPPVAEEVNDKPRRRRWPWVAVPLVLLFLAVMAVGGYLLTDNLRSTDQPQQVRVPTLQGMTVQSARAKLNKAGLQPRIQRRFTAKAPKGRIFDQNPPPGATAREGSTVTVRVSKGRNMVQVPADLVGMTQTEATQALQEAGLNLGDVKRKSSSEYDEGVVMKAVPGAGSSAPKGSSVKLTVSKGVSLATVPNVISYDEERATEVLENSGFDVEVSETVTDDAPAGTVVRQTPSGGTDVEPGSTVTLYVATEPETTAPTTPPTPTPPTSPPPTEDEDDGGIFG